MEQKNKMKDTLYQRLLDAGYPAKEIYHHYSDMYFYKTPKTTAVLRQWCDDHLWSRNVKNWLIQTFTDQVTGKPMYDVAFQYEPFWENPTRGEQKKMDTKEEY